MALGDEIIALSKGRRIGNKELISLYDSIPPRHDGRPIIKQIDYTPKPPPISGKYYTFQFDRGWGQRTWCPETQWSVRQLHGLYHHYKQQYNMVDIGHKKYNLTTTADIIMGSQGHVGICSGMGWFSVACGKKPYIYYATNSNYGYLTNWKRWWEVNGIKIRYFDEEFKCVPCKIAVDGKKYKKI